MMDLDKDQITIFCHPMNPHQIAKYNGPYMHLIFHAMLLISWMMTTTIYWWKLFACLLRPADSDFFKLFKTNTIIIQKIHSVF